MRGKGMILITGGAWQGKTAYAVSHYCLEDKDIADGAVCSPVDVLTAPAVSHFHLLIRRMMENDEDPDAYSQRLMRENPDLIVITDEIGCGIVPMDPFERAWREKTGRICISLAAFSRKVIRMNCGIAAVIKDADH